MSLKRRTPPVVLPDISEKASQPAILKKDLPDELYPGAPIEDMGSTVPEAEPADEKKETKASVSPTVGAVIYNTFLVMLFLKIGNHSFGIDTVLSNLNSLEKDITPHLLLFSFIICAVGGFLCIVPALLVRFVAVRQPLSEDLQYYALAPILISYGVVGLLQRIRLGGYLIPFWFLIFAFLIHIFRYDKGGLFKTFFLGIWHAVSNFFKRIF